ncbi:hypothetical protein D1224_06840 [Henriciella barbarensis]|uniref:Uncharacterized protein n=1 Tax=Henriciella barbarensis TaxID=86342 RepID=A0A399R357_9PROT|nr:hypothetical protein [Henriciella barbarensis]RIJ23959.1 hypothetical protein D1224_06840 [Henriciella barbarensis]
MEYRLPSDLWLLSSTVSVVEATLLLLNIEPQSVSQFVEGWDDDKKPVHYIAARNALVGAIRGEQVSGELVPQTYEKFPQGGIEVDYERIDHHASYVYVQSLASWLCERGFDNTIFARSGEKKSGFRDPSHPRYSAKLVAAVEAWEAFDEDSNERGTPKQRLAKWLRLNAARFGLTNDDGKPSENVIEELAKIGNWATTGGAPKQKSDEPGPDKTPQ